VPEADFPFGHRRNDNSESQQCFAGKIELPDRPPTKQQNQPFSRSIHCTASRLNAANCSKLLRLYGHVFNRVSATSVTPDQWSYRCPALIVSGLRPILRCSRCVILWEDHTTRIAHPGPCTGYICHAFAFLYFHFHSHMFLSTSFCPFSFIAHFILHHFSKILQGAC